MNKCYSGVGTTKTDAKTNAAANALEELREDSSFVQRERKLHSDRRGLLLSEKHAFALMHPENKLSGQSSCGRFRFCVCRCHFGTLSQSGSMCLVH